MLQVWMVLFSTAENILHPEVYLANYLAKAKSTEEKSFRTLS